MPLEGRCKDEEDGFPEDDGAGRLQRWTTRTMRLKGYAFAILAGAVGGESSLPLEKKTRKDRRDRGVDEWSLHLELYRFMSREKPCFVTWSEQKEAISLLA